MNNKIISGIQSILLVGLLATALPVQAASFDCAKAVTKVEKLICGDAELSKLDDELATQYRMAMQSPLPNEMVRKRQKAWIREREICSDVKCLRAVYEKRIQELVSGVDIPRRWYVQQGKGRALCEELAQLANANPSIGVTPNIPWDKVLSIRGVSEPAWSELDPVQHEELFLMARDTMDKYASYLIEERMASFVQWFKPGQERQAPLTKKAETYTDVEAQQIYREFVKRGGKLRALRLNIGDETGPLLQDIVQYEQPETDRSKWDGYTLVTDPSMQRLPDRVPPNYLGRGYRVLMYMGDAYSFSGYEKGSDEYRVTRLSGRHSDSRSVWYCKIDSFVIRGE